MLFVQLPYPNASPAQIERTDRAPGRGGAGLGERPANMWSHCDDNGGNVGLEFDWSQNMKVARTEVWEKIDRIRRDLPDDIGDIIVSNNWDAREAEMPIIEGRLSSKRDLSRELRPARAPDRQAARAHPRRGPRAPGRRQPARSAHQPRVAELEAHGVDVRDVIARLRSSNFDQSLGKITDGDSRWSLRMVGTFDDVDEIQNFPIRADGLRLKDIADVRYEEPPLEYGRHLDGDFAIGVTVTQESKANTVEVCDAVRSAHRRHGRRPRAEGRELPDLVQPGRRDQEDARGPHVHRHLRRHPGRVRALRLPAPRLDHAGLASRAFRSR